MSQLVPHDVPVVTVLSRRTTPTEALCVIEGMRKAEAMAKLVASFCHGQIDIVINYTSEVVGSTLYYKLPLSIIARTKIVLMIGHDYYAVIVR